MKTNILNMVNEQAETYFRLNKIDANEAQKERYKLMGMVDLLKVLNIDEWVSFSWVYK